jgi:glycosyltransferase involved in cell wall biosynthesis
MGGAVPEGYDVMARDRIALFLPSLAGGGAERVFVQLANEFARSGRRVDLILLRREGAYLSHLDQRVRMVSLGSSNARGAFSLARELRADPPAVLISAMDVFNLMAITARFLSRVRTPVVITLHLHLTTHARTSKKLHARLLPLLAGCLYRHAAAIVAVSRGVAEDAASITKLPIDQIRVVHNPLPAPAGAGTPLHHPWLNNVVPVLVSAGRLDHQKDFQTLLRAFAGVLEHKAARLIILGEGPDRARIEQTVVELGLAEHVALPGFVANPFEYYSHARAFVLSSRYEGFGMVLVEALSCGCPVVSTDCPSGPAEILENGTYGTLVPVGDVQAMANAIRNVLDAPLDRLALKRRAAQFALEPIAKMYLDLIDRVVMQSQANAAN